ncbi:MAG TPA: ATP-binding protein [Thermoleophilaceae bacterium]
MLAVALGCAAVFAAAGRSIDRQRRDDSRNAAAMVTASVASQVEAVNASLEDAAAFLASSRVVTPAEFAAFARAPLSRPAVRSLAYVQRVTPATQAAFERRLGVAIRTFGARREQRNAASFPVALSASRLASHRNVIGVDSSTEPLRHAAMSEALLTRQPVATPPLRSLRGTWQPLIYVPVVRHHRDLAGFVAAAIDPHALVETARAAFPGTADVRVRDGSRTVFSTPADYSRARRGSVMAAGRRWTVDVISHAPTAPVQRLRWIVAVVGLLLLTTLFVLFRRAIRQAQDAEALVTERTRELDTALTDAQTARTALSERNESLLELDRFKDRMLGLISHDLRSPLTSIRGYVELLLDEETGALSEDQLRFLAVVKRNAERLDSQIGDLLLLAGIAEGTLSLQRSAVDLPRLVMEAVETAAPHAQQKNIKLEAGCRPLRPIDADGSRLAQVLDNLLSNAIKYTPEGGSVDVRAWYEDDWVSLSVADSGIGMTQEELESIFLPFFRTEDARERGIKGTGLGLVIVKAVVEAHGGSVRVHSHPGGGSRFTIMLPADSPAPWEPPKRLTTLRA